MAPNLKFGQPGAIVRARLRNFMTYNDTTLQPGPNLNMVVGPNGSGKSAIVCSIIVGLAGDVTLTGRANSIASLVQKGSDWGSTEIELFNDNGRNYVIERKISIVSRCEAKIEHKSDWKLNGVSVQKKKIQELITNLNIKVDNLCQFLPQDSVASFVKMSPVELLINTLKAVGDSQLVEDLNTLTQLTSEIYRRTLELEELKKASVEHEVNARRLETEVEEIREREQLIKKKVVCALKILYIRYDEAVKNCDRAKDELKDLMEELRQKQSCGKPFSAKVNIFKKEEERHKEVAKSCYQESKHVIETIQKNSDILKKRELECQENFAQFEHKRDQEKQRGVQISLKQQDLENYECRLVEIRDVDYEKDLAHLKSLAKDVQFSLKQKTDTRHTIESALRKLVLDIDDELQKRNELVSVKDKRLQFVIGRRRELQQVCDYLSRNRDKFQKKIFLPMYCEINIKDNKYTDCVEYTINEHDLYAFVCQTEDDLRVFTDHTHNVLKARINVILQPDKSLEDFEKEVAQRGNPYQGLDFKGYLKDMIDAPEPILRYLYGQYKLHQLPIFGNLTERDLKRLMDTCPRFFVKNKIYQVNRSRYDQEKTIFSEAIREARFMKNLMFDKKQLEDLDISIKISNDKKKELKEKMLELNEEHQTLQREFLDLNKRSIELSNKQNEKARIVQHIELCRKKLKELQVEKIDIEAEKVCLQESIKKINLKSIEDLERLSKIFESYAHTRRKFVTSTLMSCLARNNRTLAQRDLDQAMLEANELEQKIRQHKDKIRTLEAAVNRHKLAAEERISGFRNDKLDKTTKKKFSEIPIDTVESLEMYEEELKARIQGMANRAAGNQLLSEFNRMNEELEDKRKRIARIQLNIASMTEQRQQIKDNFIAKLDIVIKVIDEHYRDFMRKLNYDGKVEVARDSAYPDDFSKYGINIMVKYRDNEQLIPLSSTRQSGGERSVATMIYMLALQTKTSVPFRVVDEINQGMDKDNERKVFELLVRTANESSSQYFLVSPKLLSGLDYGDQMQIHIVFNGPELEYSFADLRSAVDSDEGNESDEDTVSDRNSPIYV